MYLSRQSLFGSASSYFDSLCCILIYIKTTSEVIKYSSFFIQFQKDQSILTQVMFSRHSTCFSKPMLESFSLVSIFFIVIFFIESFATRFTSASSTLFSRCSPISQTTYQVGFLIILFGLHENNIFLRVHLNQIIIQKNCYIKSVDEIYFRLRSLQIFFKISIKSINTV